MTADHPIGAEDDPDARCRAGGPASHDVVMSQIAHPTLVAPNPVASDIEMAAGAQDAPVPYHRIARVLPDHRWWRPFAVLVMAVLAYAGMMLPILVGLVIAILVDPGVGDAVDRVLGGTDMHDPATFLVALGSIALLYPAVAFGVRVGGRRSAGTLSSTAGGLRWLLLGRSVGVALAVMVTLHAGWVAWDLVVHGVAPTLTWDHRSGALLAGALLLMPFQAAAEEYAFRGLPQQLLGSWLRNPWWGILLPIPLFTLGHVYDWRGLIDVALFALAAGILTWRTGGLEAAIGLHVVNNSLIAVLGSVGAVDLNATTFTAPELLTSVAATGLYTLLILRHPTPVTGLQADVERPAHTDRGLMRSARVKHT